MTRVGLRSALGATLALVLVLPGVVPSATAAPQPNGRPVITRAGWLPILNFYRKTAGLEPLTEVRRWSADARLHSRYMTTNGIIAHTEDLWRPNATTAGLRAARNGNVTLTMDSPEATSHRGLIERWMASPFHAAAMLDPTLERTGFGIHRLRLSGGRMNEGATLDVLRGRTGQAITEDVVWPAEGMQVPITRYPGGEYPDPLAPCKGYRGAVGLPLVVNRANGARVTAASLTGPSGDLKVCHFDGSTYRSPRAREQREARALLAERDTVVIVPRKPLVDGPYTASITTKAGEVTTWSFTIGEVEPPRNARIQGAPERAFQERTSVSVGWWATDRQSGVAHYGVRWRRAALGQPVGTWQIWQQQTTAHWAPFDAEPGHTYCFANRATDRAGNRSGWGKEVCTTMPLRSIDLDADPSWVPLIAGDHYAGVASTTGTPGAVLAGPEVMTKRVVVLASRSPGSGSIEILWNGKPVTMLSLVHVDRRNRDQFHVIDFPRPRLGTVSIRAVGDGPVVVEGLGISQQ